MPLRVQDLQDIATICEQGSIRKAAVHIGISQPTLSARVGQMERRLGAALLDRSKGRSRPTQLAMTIVAQSADLLKQLGNLGHQVRELSTGKRGVVRLGFGPVPAYCMLESLIAGVTESLPDVTLLIRTDSAGNLLNMLAAGEIDLAFCDGDPSLARPGFIREPALGDHLAMIVEPDDPLAGESAVSLRRVFERPVALVILDPRYEAIIRQAVDAEPLSLPRTVYCNTLWVLEPLVRSGQYRTIAPIFTFGPATARGDLVAVPLAENIWHDICLYSNRSSLPLPAIEAVKEIIRRQSRDLQPHLAASGE